MSELVNRQVIGCYLHSFFSDRLSTPVVHGPLQIEYWKKTNAGKKCRIFSAASLHKFSHCLAQKEKTSLYEARKNGLSFFSCFETACIAEGFESIFDETNNRVSVASFDLECFSPQLSKFPDPTQDECVIFQIGLCFRASNECDLQRWLFALNSNLKIAADHFMAFLFDDERSLIEAFLQQINCLDPDVLLTFNGSKFDWPYLASRCRKNGLSLNVLSRLSHALVSVRPVGPKNLRIVSIPGRAVLDVFQFLRLFHSVDESSYSLSLDSASKRWLSSNCWKLDVPFWNIFLAFTTEDSKVWNEVASYCVRDCESCLALFDELNVWKRTRSLCNVFRCSLDEILVRSPGMLTWKLLRQLGFSNQWWVKFRPSRKMYPNSFCWTVGLRFRPGLYHNVGVESTTAFFNQTIFERSLDKENDDDDLLKQAVEYLQSSKESTIALKTFYTGLVRDVLSRSAASELIELRNRKIAQKFESRFVFATENFVFFYSSQEADSKYSSFCVFSKTKAVGLARDQNRVVYYGIWFPFLLAKLVCDSCLQLFLQGSSEEEIRKTFEQEKHGDHGLLFFS
ncbi:DNA polymerase delta catalytic chain [Galdieria sulphuraria]|uniref:DNA polymerase delta catalytic subunit n=1 Tax=Galdieria sulphuraria TaxID=130081 RepID=M2VRU1_GALSU|nr:DNA polymerase delta catalytic chain [Galdieria sulphuraria]EME25826.1 DNA polymerase delta catalytic chain [Galdieria sulphuraria]|eukprot:XP_005702346.1 DNA polymerase delta catalytic chain [Galdieria sulphuraria]